MIDMKRWEELAAARVHARPQAPGLLQGKLAIVTGSAQGFGKGIAEALYREGACVAIADLNEPLAQAVAASLGERAFAVKVNVAEEESVAAMIQATVERFGGLDLLISNAGVLRAGSLDELEKRDFEFVTAINYTAFFTCVKYAQRIMRAQHQADPGWWGDIIEINSRGKSY